MEHRISDAEWGVLEALWEHEGSTTAELTALLAATGWKRNTVHTFLTRMEAKGYVRADAQASPKRYYPAVARETCRREETENFLSRVWQGSAAKLVSAFVREHRLTAEETAALRRLLDDSQKEGD